MVSGVPFPGDLLLGVDTKRPNGGEAASGYVYGLEGFGLSPVDIGDFVSTLYLVNLLLLSLPPAISSWEDLAKPEYPDDRFVLGLEAWEVSDPTLLGRPAYQDGLSEPCDSADA